MKVQLVSKTVGVGKYENLSSEEIVAAIARHGQIKNDNGRLVKYLMKNHHWSPLDMINFTFEVETSRAIGRQMLRHASIKPQEHSQRYSDKVEFEDVEIRFEHPTNRQSSTDVVFNIFTEHGSIRHERALDASIDMNYQESFAQEIFDTLSKLKFLYEKGIELGYAKECMRNILPECTTTTLSFNGSLRSWLAFLNVRMDHHAQKEVQEVAKLIGELLEDEMPNVFSSIEWRNGMFM